jgi:hypothetical protein
MKLVLALTFALAACGGIQPKRESPLVNEGSDTSETCCCKSNPNSSEDNKPHYQPTPRLECSEQQGECEPDVQCRKIEPPAE